MYTALYSPPIRLHSVGKSNNRTYRLSCCTPVGLYHYIDLQDVIGVCLLLLVKLYILQFQSH